MRPTVTCLGRFLNSIRTDPNFGKVREFKILVYSVISIHAAQYRVAEPGCAHDSRRELNFLNSGVSYTVRYRLTNRQSEDSVWKYVRTTDNQARLNLAEVQNGDELQVQVINSRLPQVINRCRPRCKRI